MDDVHGRIAFSNANCALPKTGQKRRWRKVRFWHFPEVPRWAPEGGSRFQSGLWQPRETSFYEFTP